MGPDDPLANRRAELLTHLGITTICEVKVMKRDNPISPELLAFARIFSMALPDLVSWNVPGKARNLLDMDCDVGTTVESKAWAFIFVRLSLLLNVLSTTKEAEEEALSNQGSAAAPVSRARLLIYNYKKVERFILEQARNYAGQRK